MIVSMRTNINKIMAAILESPTGTITMAEAVVVLGKSNPNAARSLMSRYVKSVSNPIVRVAPGTYGVKL